MPVDWPQPIICFHEASDLDVGTGNEQMEVVGLGEVVLLEQISIQVFGSYEKQINPQMLL